MASRFRVDHDSEGNAEVSSAKPRKLRPIETEEDNPQPGATGQPPAGKSALKKSALKGAGSKKDIEEPSSNPSSPSSPSKTPKSALKSALKGGATNESLASVDSNAPAPPPKSALKSAMKSGSGSQKFEPTPPPPTAPPPTPGKPKSALKARSFTNPDGMEQKSAPPAPPAPAPPMPQSLKKPSPGAGRARPSMFKMTIEIADPGAWSARALCRHYFHFAGQKMMWDSHVANTTGGRKSIKLSDFALFSAQVQQAAGEPSEAPVSKKASETGKRKSLVSSPHVILEEDAPTAPAADLVNSEISPLKELLLAKKPNSQKLRDLLKGMADAERTKWINASLDSTPPPMPAPLFHTVAAAQWDAVGLLIEFKVNVLAQYEGKSMLKGWIKPMTPLVECVKGRKGRFVGTMLGDKLEAVETLLNKAAKEQQRGGESDTQKEQRKEMVANFGRKRTKSIHLKCSRGLMMHTQGHPNMKYELNDKFCTQSLSSVRAAMDMGTNQPVAIKAGSKIHEQAAGDPEALLWNEIVILRKLEHPNIIKLYETFEDDSHIFMVFELCKGGELFDRLVSMGSFGEKTVMRLAYQMGAAIRHLHELRICHRDIRPEAFMVQQEGPLDETCVKLIDFNTAKEIGTQPLTTKICTLHYVAPEVLTSKGYNEKVDIWSLGVVIYVMAAGVPPFDAENELDVLKAVKAGSFSFEPEAIWEEFSPGVKDMIKSLMTRDPEQRPDISKVMDLRRMTQAEEEGAMFMSSKGDGSEKGQYDHQKTIRVAFAMLSENISDSQIVDLRRIFRELDTAGSGMVNIADCRSSLEDMVNGLEGVDELKELLTSDKLTGKVNYAMFLATMTDKRRHIRREAARQVFNTFDIDKNGNVSLYEIAQALTREKELRKEEGKNVNSKEVSAIWEEMREVFGDQEYEDKELSFEDFFKQLPRANLDICV